MTAHDGGVSKVKLHVSLLNPGSRCSSCGATVWLSSARSLRVLQPHMLLCLQTSVQEPAGPPQPALTSRLADEATA
jgi:hypothetical protein